MLGIPASAGWTVRVFNLFPASEISHHSSLPGRLMWEHVTSTGISQYVISLALGVAQGWKLTSNRPIRALLQDKWRKGLVNGRPWLSSALPLQGEGVWALVGELRSHVPLSQKEKKQWENTLDGLAKLGLLMTISPAGGEGLSALGEMEVPGKEKQRKRGWEQDWDRVLLLQIPGSLLSQLPRIFIFPSKMRQQIADDG